MLILLSFFDLPPFQVLLLFLQALGTPQQLQVVHLAAVLRIRVAAFLAKAS